MILFIKLLLNVEGIRYIFFFMVKNFIGFVLLGIVLVVFIGIGVVEGSGFMGVIMKKVVIVILKRFLILIVVLVGVMFNIVLDVGYVVLIFFGVVIFLLFGRYLIVGFVVVFVGVLGGFLVNFLFFIIDLLLFGIIIEVVKLLNFDYFVNLVFNYYFMCVLIILIIVMGIFIIEKIIEFRLGEYKGEVLVDYNELIV